MSLKEEILRLKKEKNAVILAHYYTTDEVQEIADYVGDSFFLSKKAKELDENIIVYCGVSFMGESAKILNSDKLVLMPDMSADCAMAHMVDLENIKKVRAEYEDVAVVCYINSTAEIKCYADVCVTSSNAVKIVKNLPNKNIFFIPDGNLGRYVAEQVPEKNVILNQGYCPVHHAMTVEELHKVKTEHPEAKFVVHPECIKALLDEADYIGSTSGIINYVAKDSSKEYIIGTEIGVLYELKKQNPDKKFYLLSQNQICHDMKFITLEKIYDVLANETNRVEISEARRDGALKPLERMLELGK
ncbi:MAG: quinolinate synthase NadA [Agathobacter sp.]|nr:quinolinate synthase NadA [Agathobacter sp.]